MEKRVEFKVNISDVNAEAWKRLDEARKTIAKIESEILDAYKKSDRAKAAYDLSGYGNYGTKYNPSHHIDGSRISTSIMIDVADDAEKSSAPQLYLGEKTINALINGKLLNDDQKKALLKQIGVDLDSLTETAGA